VVVHHCVWLKDIRAEFGCPIRFFLGTLEVPLAASSSWRSFGTIRFEHFLALFGFQCERLADRQRFTLGICRSAQGFNLVDVLASLASGAKVSISMSVGLISI
jgi:hypothetical protein